MNTFQLTCFLAVASTLSFVRAAQQLNVSQPTITHQIKMLENELNVQLFRRSTRLVEITQDGQAFISDAKSMVAIAEQAKMRYKTHTDKQIESLSIGCSNYTQLGLLIDILNELSAAITNIHPQLFVVPHEQLFNLLERERADVIFDIRESRGTKGETKYRELAQSSLVCVCRYNHRLAGKEYITMQELGNETLIFCDPINIAPDIAKLQWKLAEGRNPTDVHFCNSSEASRVLAGAGLGVAILPELFVHNMDCIVKIPLKEAPKLSFGMFYKSRPGDYVLRKFIKITKNYFSDEVE